MLVQEIAAALALQKEKQLEEGDPDKNYIYNTDVLHDKLEDIAWTDDQPWEETLAVTSTAPTQVNDVDDDLERELAFYNQVCVCVARVSY